MEYPMATLITGFQPLRGLIGVTVHELMHSWYHMALGNNELKYPWMDEGFTSYASTITSNYLSAGDSLGVPNFNRAMKSVIYLSDNEKNEPLSIHADHYITRFAHAINAYSKGAIYLHQLSYIIGQKNLDETLLRYYDQWKYKHPEPRDFMLVAEKVSGLELDWYNEYYVYSTRKVDYAIKAVYGKADETRIVLERVGDFILPVDLEIELNDGNRVFYNIPLRIMRGHKPVDDNANLNFATPWFWVDPTYVLTIPYGINNIKSLHIDPETRTTDVDRENNDIEIKIDEGMLYIFER
jgi:aminopeptidase N